MSALTAPSDLELVVARHRERVDWTRNLPRGVRVTLYDKGGDLDPTTVPRVEVHRLENVGLEAHTYLHHLVTRHEDLAPVTIFCQGHPFDHVHDLHRLVRSLVSGEDSVTDFRWLGFIIDTDDARGRRLFVPWSKNLDGRELDLDGFLQALLGEEAPEWLRFYPGGHFALTREQARRRDVAFYRRALELTTEFPDAAFCFERVWDRVFATVGVDPEVLGGEMCRYLKPIRRIEERGAAALAMPGREDP